MVSRPAMPPLIPSAPCTRSRAKLAKQPANKAGEQRFPNPAGVSVMEKARALLMRKLGILETEKDPAAAHFSRYEELFKEPLTADTMVAFATLARALGKIDVNAVLSAQA